MKSDYVRFKGGIVTEQSPLSRDAGSCLFATNYEIPTSGGYRRIDGYSLVDGAVVPAAVPGSGPIRGVFIYKNVRYALRDNALGTAGVLFKESTAGWAVVASTFPAGGQYEFIQFNFYASTGTINIYGVNGVGKAFQFDGTTVTFYTTGMVVDTPNHIVSFSNHLFLSFPGGSVQHSAPGTPGTWSAIVGAGELGVGDDVTGFSVEAGGTLVIMSRNRVHLLTGTGVSSWVLTEYASDSGCLERTVQRMGKTMFLDDRGLSDISASDTFGDFSSGTFSVGFRPLVTEMLLQGVQCSVTIKEKNQYVIFFQSGRALCCSFAGGSFIGATTWDFPDVMTAVFSGEINGVETTIAGDDAGNVYDLFTGTSFNGTEIMSLLRLNFYAFKTPNRRKRFRRLFLEAQAEANITFQIAPEFNYGSEEAPTALTSDFSMYGAGGFWEGDNWESFNWSTPISPTGPVRITGVGVNMSLLFYHNSAIDMPFILFGMVVDYDDRGQVR